jgi:cytosine/adenosine deaminase-related metal-dependent hydrolase
MSRIHRAAWVLPIAGPPIRDGWVAVDDARIVEVGCSDPSTTLARTVILPGLVNAHVHLELSWMRGRVPPGDRMPAWAERLIALRRAEEQAGSDSIVEAIDEARACGTALVGDVTNTLTSCGPLARGPLSAAIFFELIGFGQADAERTVDDAEQRLAAIGDDPRVRATIVPHAPYSVSPSLFRAIARAAGDRPVSVHLGESPEEIHFLRDGSGPWRELLEKLDAWSDAWTPPACGPVEYLDRLGLLNERLLAVHAVQLTDDELRHLASAGATVVTCPRSNRWTGVGDPPVERFFRAGVHVAIGTDSLASVEDLNLFEEMAAVRRLAPSVPARWILESATLTGARALGFDSDLGSIAAGKRAELIAVRIPAGVDDVEEYLVGGIQPSDVSWL